jgi:hypothetical protein
VLANQVVDALEVRNYVLQRAITRVTIGTAAVEFLDRPIGSVATIFERNNNNLHGLFAIRKGLQIYDQEPFDIFSCEGKFVHSEGYKHSYPLKNGSPERNCHFLRLPEHGCRVIGLVMKTHAEGEFVRSWPARRYDDANPGPSQADLTGQF